MIKHICYGISPYDSGGFKSSNPHAGIYKADSTRTLDLNGGNPACNQGGVVICQAVFEGNGCRPSHQGLGIKAGTDEMYTLNSTEVHGVITERSDNLDSEYDVRRLTPTECARLQGFPPDWCSDVPHSDSAEYKLWGNGIALPSILPMMQNAVNLVKEMKSGTKTEDPIYAGYENYDDDLVVDLDEN